MVFADNTQQTVSQNQQSNGLNAEMMKKKKLEMIAKMKAKQQNFLKKVNTEQKNDEAMSEESKNDDIGKSKQNEMTCASCQESLSL